MPTIKQSFKHSASNKKSEKKSSLGTEHAATIVNNPKNYPQTGQWKIVMPKVSPACLACQMCVKNCPEAVIEIGQRDGKKRAVIDYNYCKGCGICADICPVKAIKMGKKV